MNKSEMMVYVAFLVEQGYTVEEAWAELGETLDQSEQGCSCEDRPCCGCDRR